MVIFMKKASTWIIIFSFLILLSGAYIFISGRISGKIAVIESCGKTIKTINLDTVDLPYSFEVSGENGSNTVYVEKGRIRVASADCPDKLCVHQGAVSSPAVPIVCLPNELVISIKSNSASEPDAVTGG